MPGVGNYDVKYTLILQDQMTKTLAKAQAATKGFNSYLQEGGNQITSMFSKGNIAMMGIGAGIAVVGKAIKEAMDFEQTSIQMEVMLGSAEKAKDLLHEIEQFAAATPFESKDLIESTKLLLQFGVSEKKVMGVMKQFGDITAGDANKLHAMTLAFGQMSSTGRLMGQDLNQMINAGFNPLEYISKKTGQSIAELKREMEKGNISVQMVEEAFADATKEGGRFHGMMEKQSKTMGGQWSTAMDQFNVSLRNAGTQILPQLTSTLAGFNKMISGENVGTGYLQYMKGLFQTVNPIGWGWKFIENRTDAANKSAKYVIPTYMTLHDQMKQIASSSLSQLNTGLTHHTKLIETAAMFTDDKLTAALDRAKTMYGLTTQQIDLFLGKVREQKALFGESSRTKTITEESTKMLEEQIKGLKGLQEELDGTKKGMKDYKSIQKDIDKRQREIDRREGGGKGTKGLTVGAVTTWGWTTISSRAPQYYTINIQQLVGSINTKKEFYNESDAETTRKVTVALVGALNDTQLIAANK